MWLLVSDWLATPDLGLRLKTAADLANSYAIRILMFAGTFTHNDLFSLIRLHAESDTNSVGITYWPDIGMK